MALVVSAQCVRAGEESFSPDVVLQMDGLDKLAINDNPIVRLPTALFLLPRHNAALIRSALAGARAVTRRACH